MPTPPTKRHKVLVSPEEAPVNFGNDGDKAPVNVGNDVDKAPVNAGNDGDKGMYNLLVFKGNSMEITNPSNSVKTALRNIGEDDPGVGFDWNVEHLNSAVAFANQNMPALPAWFAGGAYPITALQLQDGITGYLSLCGSGQKQGVFLLAPNTLAQFAGIQQGLTTLMLADPFLGAICAAGANHPLARIYTYADGKRPMTAEYMPPLQLPLGVGVAVFD